MPSMQEDGGLTPQERSRIIAEERLRARVRMEADAEVIQEMEVQDAQERRRSAGRIVLYLLFAVLMIGVIFFVMWKTMDHRTINEQINAPRGATGR